MAFFQRAASGHTASVGYLARLTKLYSDTKQSYESLTSATNAKAALEQQRSNESEIRDDADVAELRRDFQIQQDRLLAWGISWSESGEDTESFREGGEKAHGGTEKDIDREIEKAGLGEVVASVMSQIKGLLDQSGRLQHPERYEAMGPKPGGIRPKKEWSQHEVKTGRVLLEQLTTCIDVLYSLSEGREQQPGKEKEKEARREKGRGLEDDVAEAFGYQRTQSPRQMSTEGEKWNHPLYVEFGDIDFESGTGFGMADPPPYDADYVEVLPRERKVGIMRGQNKPILVEFLTADIPPYMIGTSDDVFEMHELGEKLCRHRKSLSWCGHLRLIGFTVAPKGPRCGMVYELPTGVGHQQLLAHRTLESAITESHNQAHHQGSAQPNLEDRFRLAYNLMVSVLGYFANGDSHTYVNSSNVLLIGKEATPRLQAKADIRCPFLIQSCQDLVTPAKSEEPLSSTIYRHPAHEHHQGDSNNTHFPAYDIYSLGLVLLEIGLWVPLAKLWKPKYDRRIFMDRVQRLYSQKLASKCGTKYMRLVQRCLHAPAELLGKDQPEEAGAMLLEISKELRLCLALDEEGMPSTADLETFELLIIEQMCRTEEMRSSQPEPSTTLPRLQIPGTQKPERQYSGTTNSGSDAVKRKAIPQPTADSVPVPVEAKPQERKKKRSASSQLKKWPELPIEQQDLDQWNTMLMPRLRKLLEDALNESPESCSVSLMKIGATPEAAKTTICVQCQNTAKVHETLRKRFKPKKGWGVVILKGDVHRSGQSKPRRSGGRKKTVRKPKEQKYQEKPTCGASIGAFRDNEHLPPCTFGGTILVDGEPFGMTVHHMLDAPSDSEDEDEYSSEEEEENKPRRSAAQGLTRPELSARISSEADFGHMQSSLAVSDDDVDLNSELELSPDEDDDMLSLSDTESEASTIRPDYAITDDSGTDHWFLDDSSDTTTPSLIADDFSDEEEDDIDDNASVGDKPAVVPYSLECEELAVTQPALDDVDEDFFPSEEDRDEDHLASHTFGRVHASSGIRRVTRGMLKHEVDWALIRIEDDRLDVANLIASSFSAGSSPKKPGQPCKVPPGSVEASAAAKQIRDSIPTLTSITPANKMSGLPVSCHARSSGFTHGRISQAMCLVKLHGRRSFSYSWCVDSTPAARPSRPSAQTSAPQRSIAAPPQHHHHHHHQQQHKQRSVQQAAPAGSALAGRGGILGVPGDSGAWVYNPNTGELAGHVLAYGEKMKQAYIAPMEVLFEDIKARLGAARVELPGGAGVLCGGGSVSDDEKENEQRFTEQVREVAEGLRGFGLKEQQQQQGREKRSSGGTEVGAKVEGVSVGKGKGVGVDVDVDGVVPAVGRVAVAGSSC